MIFANCEGVFRVDERSARFRKSGTRKLAVSYVDYDERRRANELAS
jgi:hypothetical protein